MKHPEWCKWVIFNNNGVLYACHTGGRVDIPPDHWELTGWALSEDKRMNKNNEIGAFPAPWMSVTCDG